MLDVEVTDILARVTVDGQMKIRRSESSNGTLFQVGDNVLEAMPWLVGYENDMARLAERMGEPLILHNIALMSGTSDPSYVTLTARSTEDEHVLIELKDIGEVAALQARLLQKHNELSLAFDELDQARIAAEDAAKSKSAFIANISHELRTPLNVIIGNAELLARNRDMFNAEELDDYANDIWKSGRYLLELVNDLLDLAKSEAGRLVLVEDVCDFGIIADSAINLTQGLPAAHNIRLAVSPPFEPVSLWADARRLKQILINLLSNAIKFSPDNGRVELRYELSDKGELICEIVDQGPGLTRQEINRIMEPFVQGEAPRRGESGTGLGLSMVQSLVDLHQGYFSLISEKGTGTTARFVLPAARVHAGNENDTA